MKKIYRFSLVVLLLCSALPSEGLALNQQTEQGALTADIGLLSRLEIGAAGVDRPADALSLLGAFQSLTLDGYTVRLSPFGLSTFDTEGPLVILDGQPQFFDLFGLQQYNLLPVSVSDIKSISYDPLPAQSTIFRSVAGIINIETVRPTGWSARGTLSLANEVNDPGPFRYTDQATRNIDRDGPRADLRVSFGSAPWFVQASFRSDEHHVTKESSNPRIWTVFSGQEKARLTLSASEFLMGYRSDRAEHTVRAGQSSFRDFLFLDVIGREVPLTQEWSYITASGAFPLGSSTSAQYFIDRRRVDVLLRPVKIPFGPGSLEDRSTAGISFRMEKTAWTVAAGTGLSLRSFRNDPSEPPVHIRTARASLHVSRRMGQGITQDLMLLGTTTIDEKPSWSDLGYAVQWKFRWLSRAGTMVHFAASFNEVHPDEASTLPFLLARGLQLPMPELYSVHLPPELQRQRTYHAESGLRFSVSETMSVHLRVIARQYQGLTLPDFKREFFPWATTFDSETFYRTDISGRVATLGAELSHRSDSETSFSLAYYWTRLIQGGDQPFIENWKPMVGHRVIFSLLWSPTERFRLYSRVEWTSHRTWPTYAEIPSNKIPGYVRANLTAQKDFWRDHIQISLSGLNLANVDYRPHPASSGDYLALRLSIRGQLQESGSDR